MFAIISDIHSNIEALTTVLADIEKRGIKEIYCLGDIIGYGPNPKECLDLVIEKTQVGVIGNHDYAILYEPINFNLGAERASFWTRSQLETEPGSNKRHKRWEYLGTQQMRHTFPADLDGVKATLEFVHASPKRPINEYLFPDDVYTTPTKIISQFDRFKHICFIGHTHLPGVFLDDPDFYTPEELDYVYPITPEERAIINVGSVGQPRDKDNRAAYVYIEKNNINFVRLQYDHETTAKKIREIPELDNFEADRLSEGR
ncbi:MAG: metallophosphoesterase family protein [Planctomycetes bacterium]|nr:metallophosphoesterase family protein [Planctomycetota bacterium]MBU1518784.1 metallophosphoesterase family protein [Planctomycetota bacterium]MBU2457263.1 metallophosphoesterase family protein [Planctomycetota bacterium]MBU2597357.1 metallophosphoesterase family protein [Planctomycetota bacterium]